MLQGCASVGRWWGVGWALMSLLQLQYVKWSRWGLVTISGFQILILRELILSAWLKERLHIILTRSLPLSFLVISVSLAGYWHQKSEEFVFVNYRCMIDMNWSVYCSGNIDYALLLWTIFPRRVFCCCVAPITIRGSYFWKFLESRAKEIFLISSNLFDETEASVCSLENLWDYLSVFFALFLKFWRIGHASLRVNEVIRNLACP